MLIAKSVRLNNQPFLITTLVLILTLGFIQFYHPLTQIMGATTTLTSSEIISVTNVVRQTHGLNPLHPQLQLMKAAEAKAKAMIAANAWSHDIPSETPWQFIQGEGYVYTIAGENLAKGFDTAETVVDAWYNSPSHQANLLSAEYTDIGVAVIEASYQDKEQTTLIVQFLAKEYDPLDNTTQIREINQMPMLINTLRSEKTSYVLIGLIVGLLTGTVIFIIIRYAIRANHAKRRPNAIHWKR